MKSGFREEKLNQVQEKKEKRKRIHFCPLRNEVERNSSFFILSLLLSFSPLPLPPSLPPYFSHCLSSKCSVSFSHCLQIFKMYFFLILFFIHIIVCPSIDCLWVECVLVNVCMHFKVGGGGGGDEGGGDRLCDVITHAVNANFLFWHLVV